MGLSQGRTSSIAALVILAALSSSTHGFVPAPMATIHQNANGQSRTTSFQQPQQLQHSLNSKTTFNAASKSSKTALNMSASPAAVMGVFSGGILGGALHAIAGPDHLAALLPKCCGQRWYRAGRIGALWGMGHGVSATILGLTAFGLKNRISQMPSVKGLLVGASSAMEIAVGASLIFIGLLGIKEAREWEEEIDASPKSLSAAAAETGVKSAQKRAVIFNGILHGFSWDGAPSLAPALAVATWRGSISFLLAYALGTMAAMSITTTLIGEGTRRAGELFNRPDLPQKLSLFTSVLAMGVGVFWCYLAFK